MTFDLIREPWIPVMDHHLKVQEVSLGTLFRDPAAFKEVSAENPPVTLALNRFLIALLHRAHRGPVNVDHWRRIAADGHLAVLDYLEAHRDRFDLRHPSQPFMQDLALTAAQAAPPFVAAGWQAENTSTVFSHAHAWRPGRLSAAEGARALLRLHAIDVPGLKGGHPQGGSNRSAVSSALMNSLNVWVKGESLWETLMFNLMEYDGLNAAPFAFKDPAADLPAWERPLGPPGERLPRGPVDMLTFAYRRVALFWQGDQIAGIAVTKGDSLPKDKEDPVTFEWALPTVRASGAKSAEAGIRPLRASLERQVWRDAPALVQSARQEQADTKQHRAPALLEWLLKLNDAGSVPDRLRLQMLAIVADQAKPLGWFSQTLNVPLVYMQERALWQRLHEVAMQAERHEECLRTFKGSPYQVLGEALKLDAKMLAAFDGRTRYWASLERPFLELMEALPDDRSEDDLGTTRWGETVLPAWDETLAKTVRRAFQDSIAGVADHRARALGLRRLDQRLAALRPETLETSPT